MGSMSRIASFAVVAVMVVGLPCVARSAPSDGADMFGAYRGIYQAAPDHIVGIGAFVTDDGTPTMLFSDYRSGVVRRLFESPSGKFVVGPGFNADSPAEITVEFVLDRQEEVAGIAIEPAGGPVSTAPRIPLREEEVVFQSGDATLSGTLIVPESDGPHPAIVLLHGSGPLTRHSFGPYPYFFASLGLAVLVYDKRGAGASTGTRLDAGTGRLMAAGRYPEDLTNDALAAVRFLAAHATIDGKRIGLWGSSEGGMLATQAAARSPDVAFAINSAGFVGPLWQTTLYQAGALARLSGASEADAREYTAFTQQWLDVARTGEGWDAFLERREEIRRKNERALFWSSGEFASVAEMRWYWDHVLSFDPLPALARVRVPVLGLFGEADVSTESPVAAENLRRAITAGGNPDVTVRIFPGAGHSLNDASGGRMAAGVFDSLRAWLVAKARLL